MRWGGKGWDEDWRGVQGRGKGREGMRRGEGGRVRGMERREDDGQSAIEKK